MAYLPRTLTLNTNHTETVLTRKDPLNRLFAKIFDSLPLSTRGHVFAVVGEFLGTTVFLTLAFAGVETASASSNRNQDLGVSTATKPHTPAQLLYTALVVGFSLAVTAWTFFRTSGGLFNPVVSGVLLNPASTSVFPPSIQC